MSRVPATVHSEASDYARRAGAVPPFKPRYAEAFAELDQRSFAQAHEEGSAWTVEEAVGYALESNAQPRGATAGETEA